jgi:Tfp pilus assembly protein PilN
MKRIEFNLLPQSRAEAMAAKAQQDEFFSKAVIATVICFGLFLLLFIYADVIQKAQISSANKNITQKTATLQQVPNINTILTVENQLKTAAALNQSKHTSSRIFTYLAQLTPTNASVSSLLLDFTANNVTIDGAADSANTVNAFIDALKSGQYKINGTSKGAFTNVVESSFAINTKGVIYSLSANFDPTLFTSGVTDANGKNITPVLSVPNTLTGHASTDPASVFNQGGR